MPQVSPPARAPDPAAAVLGYLNFSAGVFDPAVWRGWSDLFAVVEPAASGPVEERSDAAAAVIRLLRERLDGLEAAEPAFRDARQARQALSVLEERLLPGYRAFHVDLLEHQPPGAIERPFFLAAATQALLACGWSADDVPADEPAVAAKVTEAIGRLNDYVGWRPVAVLENGRLSEPYPHERVRPLPVYVAGAGVAHGRYHDLVAGALDILGSAPPGLLEQADFDPALLEELAIDPRAFDFLHPAASRPNYLFGLWDPERIDARGNYRRMVVQQATLDGILSWPSTTPDEAPGREMELCREASAVLAGVMLMASGLSGRGPGSHQGGLPLAELLPRIAGYRDEFYHWLLGTLPDEHRRRLEAEMQRLRQPFGGVRRHINALLATRRARQVENVTLAAVLARLGRATGAERLAARVPAASARLLARITSLVVSARRDLCGSDRRAGANASLAHLDSATDLLFRAVGCGATVDPWNILGLGGQFPLHEPGGESLADPRVDDLIAVTRSILEAYAAVWRTSGLDGPDAVATRAAAALERIASWWDRYATTTVSGVPHLSGRQILDSTREVIAALEGRRAFVGAAPPAAFWRKAVGSFSAPESHAQAATALLDEGDLDGAMGLLVHWASLLEGPAVEQSGPDWLAAAARWTARAGADTSPAGRTRVRRFLELVEANTSGVVDCLEQVAARGDATGRSTGDAEDAIGDGEAPPDEQQEERVVSAYESMVWRDSTDDGVEGGMLDVDLPGGARAGDAADVERAAEFLAGICRLLRHAVTTCCAIDARERSAPSRADIDSALGWRHTLKRLRRTFVRAADHLAATDSTPPPGMAPAEYDRLRWQRDAAVERLIDAAVQATETLRILSAWLALGGATAAGGRSAVGRLFAALLSGDADGARAALAPVQERLAGKAVLYVPLSRGGRPSRIVAARSRERLLERLAACLPRLGLVAETTSIVKLAKSLESRRPPGAASVSEFDRVFEAATGALVERIVESASTPAPDESAPEPSLVTERILAGLARLVPSLLETWMTHARQLRLSVLERLRDPKAFTATREFIERYGAGLFTQHLLTPPALRGILRGGVKHFVEQLVERYAAEPPETSTEGRPRYPARLVEDLTHGVLTVRQAAARLRLVLECIAENHAEYRDWNSTTAHSDRGEHLHMLLEFLRLKAEYERIAWTLRPVGMAHRVLARRGLHAAAAAWRGRMRDETGATAADLAGRLTALESFWGVRLASVADRVGRPFTAVLEQDELEALVPPAVREATCGAPVGAGARLEERAEGMLGQASGSGVEVPDWLERVSDVVDRAIERAEGGSDLELRPGTLPDAVPWVPVPWDAVEALLAGGQDPPAR